MKGTAVIFGASGAVGRALSTHLHHNGWQLALIAREPSALDDLGLDDGHILIEKGQSTEATDVDRCMQSAIDRFGSITAVANCIGSLLLKPAHLTTDDMWEETLRINLTSSFYILRAGIKAMMNGGGSLVFASTAAARTGFANHEAIAAAKAGIEGLVRAAAATYGAKGIRINAVAPGLVHSKMTRDIVGNETARAVSEGMHVLGRLGQPEDIASAMAWLMGAESAWVTGQILGVDGGLAHLRPRPTAVRSSVQRSA